MCLIFRGILRRQVTTPHSVYIDFKLGKHLLTNTNI